jgi:predicted ATPase
VPLTPLLIARTEGNPFFLEESVQTLVETGVLMGTPGAYRLLQPLQGMPVPATVQAVLAARIDRLPPEEKHLLQTAAVIGTEVPMPVLQTIAELPEEALHRGLAHLQAAEFLYETRLFPEPEYTFKHALTHEVAYAACCWSGGGGCTRALSRPWRRSRRTGRPSRWNAWRTMPCGARCGPRP